MGTVFQFVGVTLFLASMFVCCSTSLLSRETASRSDLTNIGWGHFPSTPGKPAYSAQRATTLSVMFAVFFGMALAGIGLGLQAQRGRAPALGLWVCGLAVIFWCTQTAFFAAAMQSVPLTLVSFALLILFIAMLTLAIGAARDMRRHPPPPEMTSVPRDFVVPYSHLHKDPPEVRLAAELEERRRKLEIQQKEIEMLEGRIKRRLQHGDD